MATPTFSNMSLHQLPADIIEGLCSFLTGFDAFNLSHSSSWWLKYLSDESVWKKRLQSSRCDAGQGREWKKRYLQARSVLFKALQVEEDTDDLDALVYLTYERREARRYHYHSSNFHLTHVGAESFSFDLWFSLLPGKSDEYFGGIILGLQSSSRESHQWPHYHQQFVMVSSAGDLYCSVRADKHIVAGSLEPNRWYHLALTYDHDIQQEEVFLDGAKVRSEVGSRHHEWPHLSYGQVGTGCVTSDTLNCPRPGHVGWYGFHGVVDAFQVWKGALSSDDVKQLASGRKLPAIRLRDSLKQNSAGHSLGSQVNVQLAKCTRPAEGKAMQLMS